MEAVLVSAGAVALAEMGDKTQLLALALASRYHKPVPIILGILLATLANHLLAALVGYEGADLINQHAGQVVLRWIVGLSFLAMAAWTLIPDRADDDGTDARAARYGVLVATLVAFFIVEMGDKTQIATVALAARFNDVFGVATGTTIGMMLANVPVVLLGGYASRRINLGAARTIAALLFAGLGVLALLGIGL